MQSVNRRVFHHIYQNITNGDYNIDNYDRDQYYKEYRANKKASLIAHAEFTYTDYRGFPKYTEIDAPIINLSPVESVITIFAKKHKARLIHSLYYTVVAV
ncbi:hypothetical protein BNJ_00318 [Kaumoebavirus]|uniref:hypothetical protein n=1 Tax=Kaumoebavirus TaxID=1859492 RepID=UPI0009C25524|nr:hypothetical protein BNJ_00318 [Kaumoebavirus]ARA72140.1 hypothetical protein BNJ_00318 [Kaumoebavirus]